MKPTQQEIIELAREHATRYTNRHYPDKPVFTFTQDALQKVIELALERFGAGGGEPVMVVEVEGGCWNTTESHNFFGIPDGTYSLYTRPSPTDLRAEYLRGLEDAKKACVASELIDLPTIKEIAAIRKCAQAIEALKGKQ